jgi:hypothetical protein
MARCTTLCDKDCQQLVAGQWFSPGTPFSSTNNTDRHDITEILLKVALNTITLTLTPKLTHLTQLLMILYLFFLLRNYTNGTKLTSTPIASEPVTSMHFNPGSWRQICITTEKSITLWQTEQSNNHYVLQSQ